MSWILLVILIVAAIFFVWQLVLFIKDAIKLYKKKKEEKQKLVDNPSNEDGRKEDK